jgi:hypothetical protein
MPIEINTLVDAINELRSRGYVCDFMFDDGSMLCKNTNSRFRPDELTIEEIFRFEGESNPDDMSVLYGISAIDGTKGIVVDAYGMYEDASISEFIKKVKINKQT